MFGATCKVGQLVFNRGSNQSIFLLMVGSEDFDEIMGLALGSREIGGKLSGAVWWSDFGESFACRDIRVRKTRACRSGLCIDGLRTYSA